MSRRTDPNRPQRSEAEEQAAVIQYCDLRHIPVFHIPNGGSRNKAEAARFKAQGVRPGVPDLFVPVPKGGYAGLFIEMKTPQGRVSEAQKRWLSRLKQNGYCTRVCRSFDEARRTIDFYMKLRRNSQ